MVELLIIADDLTGAVETGVQLTKQGISSKVVLNLNVDFQNVFAEAGCSVLIYNTESRHIPPKEAADRVTNVLHKAQSAGINKLYKKTDSTMRGNIGAELEAFLHGINQQALAFIPAHPMLKRFTRKGFHYIDEQLLHETEFAKDPLEPINESEISEILHLQTVLNVNSIDAADKNSRIPENGILVFDCRSVEDLSTIGENLSNKGLHRAIAGSAAMVELLPQLLQLEKRNEKIPKLQGPTLVVNGSLNRISLEQVKYAAGHGVKTISIPQELLTDTNFYINPNFIALRSEIKTAIIAGHDVILNSIGNNDPVELNFSIEEHLKLSRHEFIPQQIGLIVAAVLEEVDLSILAVIGGDTMSGIMEAMSCEYIEPKIEIKPGVAVSLAAIMNKNLRLVSKPGGYGSKETIMQILDYIKTSTL